MRKDALRSLSLAESERLYAQAKPSRMPKKDVEAVMEYVKSAGRRDGLKPKPPKRRKRK